MPNKFITPTKNDGSMEPSDSDSDEVAVVWRTVMTKKILVCTPSDGKREMLNFRSAGRPHNTFRILQDLQQKTGATKPKGFVRPRTPP